MTIRILPPERTPRDLVVGNAKLELGNLAGVIEEIKAIAPDVQYRVQEDGSIGVLCWSRCLSDEEAKAVDAIMARMLVDEVPR